MTHCQKCALVCTLRYFTGDSPRSRGDGRSCQSNLSYTAIGQWLCDSAISAVSTGVCLLNFVFISFVDAFYVQMLYEWAHGFKYISCILLLCFVKICWILTIVLMLKVRIHAHKIQMRFFLVNFWRNRKSLKYFQLKHLWMYRYHSFSIQIYILFISKPSEGISIFNLHHDLM